MNLKIGVALPEFFLFDQDNNLITIKDYLGKPIIIFFYPKDDTLVCTVEVCSFEKNYSKFKDLDAHIFGISSDSVSSHKKFAEKYGLSYSLLSDIDKVVEGLFGIKRSLFGLLKERVTLIFDKEGILVHSYKSQFDGRKHIKEALISVSNSH